MEASALFGLPDLPRCSKIPTLSAFWSRLWPICLFHLSRLTSTKYSRFLRRPARRRARRAGSSILYAARPLGMSSQPVTQLAPDDDDDAPSGPSDDEPRLDFHPLSDALSGLRRASQKSSSQAGPPWFGIALLISGGLALLFSARRRPAKEPLPAADPGVL